MKKLHRDPTSGSRWWRTVALLMGHEITANLRLLGASLAVGGLPYLAPWVPSLSHLPASDVRQGMAIGLGGFFSVVLHIVLGSGLLVRDLAERRSGFYYARPLASSALASGKVLGAWLMALVCQVVLFVGLWLEPLMQGRLMQERGPGEIEPLFMWTHQYSLMRIQDGLPAPLPWLAVSIFCALVSLVFLLGVHAITLWLRARSLWLLLDMLALLVLAALVRGVLWRLEGVQAFGALVWLGRLGFIVLVGALLSALWAQVHWGRTHLQNAHRAFSLTLWSVLGVAMMTAGSYGRHVVSAGPGDVTKLYSAMASPASPWLMVGGRTRQRSGFQAAFLVHTEDGRAQYLGGLDVVASWFTFSDDGSHAAWVQCQRLSQPMDCEIWHLDLEAAAAKPQASGILMDIFPDALALSPQGRRVAVSHGESLEVYDVEAWRLIFSQRQESIIEKVLFLSESRLRLRAFGLPEGSFGELGRRLLEVDIDSGKAQTTGRFRGSIVWESTHRRGDLDLVLHQTLFPSSIALMNGATGEPLFVRPSEPPAASRFLSDGRVVMRRHDKDSGRLGLEVVAIDGARLSSLERQGVRDVILGNEWAKDQIWVGLLEDDPTPAPPAPVAIRGWTPSPEEERWRLYSLDTADGGLHLLAEGLRPLRSQRSNTSPAEVGSPATRLFRAAGGAIVHWDPESKDGRLVFAPSP